MTKLISIGDIILLRPFSIQGTTIPLLDSIAAILRTPNGPDLIRLDFRNKSRLIFPFYSLNRIRFNRGGNSWVSWRAITATFSLFRLARSSGFGTTLANGIVYAAPKLEWHRVELVARQNHFAITDGHTLHPVFTSTPSSAHDLMEWAKAFNV